MLNWPIGYLRLSASARSRFPFRFRFRLPFMLLRPAARLMALDDGTPFFCATVVDNASAHLRLTFENAVDLDRSVEALQSEFSSFGFMNARASSARFRSAHTADIQLDVASSDKNGLTHICRAVAGLPCAQNGHRILRAILTF